jgi:catalase
VNDAGRSTFVKFHWKPRLGTHSLVWDETQKIAGKDPDFNRRDLWEAIEAGDFPEWELGVQLVAEEDEHEFDFDLLDATKIIPEEDVPVRPVGRLVLDRNPDNFFAETEQVAFHTANVVPGIDFTNDPLLQARLFSYLDTQLIRLGGPNFTQLPVNRPVAEVHNHHRDGYHQTAVHRGRAAYHPNTLGGGCPALAGDGYTHYQERVDGTKIRKRSASFADHYSQATLFWNSMAGWERDHIVAAFRFELGKVEHRDVREGVVRNLANVDHELAARVAEGVGVAVPDRPTGPVSERRSAALSQDNSPSDTIATRRIAILVADGVDAGHVRAVVDAVSGAGAQGEVLAATDGTVSAASGDDVAVTRSLSTVASVLYDAVLVPGGERCARTLAGDGDVLHFLSEAFKHGKAVGALGDAVSLLEPARITSVRHSADQTVADQGVVTGTSPDEEFTRAFIQAVAAHRHPQRDLGPVPA